MVLPATHNAMSAPLKGWFAAEQDRSIGGQLEDGIRGLLRDTHYADNLGNGRVDLLPRRGVPRADQEPGQGFAFASRASKPR